MLINNYDSSKYFLPALDELYMGFKKSDTTNNQNNINILYNDLKNYLEQEMQQYSNLPGFVEKAYSNYLMCLVKLRSYSEAIAGYENIINNQPDPGYEANS